MGELTFGSTFLTVRLHRHMCIQVVQGTVRLFAPLMATLVHALDFFVPTSRTLVLLSAGDGDKGVDLR